MLQEASEVMPNLEREAILAEARPFDPLTRLAEFTEKYPFAMQILRIGGVHPTEDTRMDNPYTNQPDFESFTNIGEHNLAVGSFAEAVAKGLQAVGALTEQDIGWATVRGLVHDANKRLEILRRNAMRAGVIEDAYSPKAYDTIRPILLAQDVAADLVEYLARAGAETSHLSIPGFLELRDGLPSLVPERLVDKIIHLADDMTSTSIPQAGERPLTVYLTPWERMVASDFPNRYPYLWTEGLGFDPEGAIVLLKDTSEGERNLRWVRNYAYWQPWTSNEISKEIQALLNPESTQKPEYFVKDLVNNALVPV